MATSKFKDRNLEKDTLLNIGILQNISSSSFRRVFPKEKAKQEPNEKEVFNCLLMGIFQIGLRFLNELFSCPNILGLQKEIFPLIQTAKRKGCQDDSSIFWYLSFGFM